MNELHLLKRWSGSHRQGNGNGYHASVATRRNAEQSQARPPRILLLWASVGSGHKRAADAIELAIRHYAPGAYLRSVDVLSLATRPFRRCYGQMYIDFIDRAPAVLGYFYNLMDQLRPPGPVHGWDRLRVALEQMSLRHFICFLKSEPWDLIINTHFLPAEIIA